MQVLFTELFLFIMRVLSYMPRSWLVRISNVLGIVGYFIAKKRRNIGIKNLTLCFPDMSEEEKHRIIKEHFKHIVFMALDYNMVFYANEDKVKKIVKLKNFDLILKYYKKRPIVALCAHMVGLELCALRSTIEVSAFGFYSQQKNLYFTNKLKIARERFIEDSRCGIFPRNVGLRPIIKKLRETKLALYYLPDQDFGEQDSIYTKFFAYPYCATIKALPGIVKLTDAVVIPCSFVKVGSNYEVEFFEPLENYPTDNLELDIRRMNEVLEQLIMKDITQYFWLHKRFKTQPNMQRGEIYKDC